MESRFSIERVSQEALDVDVGFVEVGVVTAVHADKSKREVAIRILYIRENYNVFGVYLLPFLFPNFLHFSPILGTIGTCEVMLYLSRFSVR